MIGQSLAHYRITAKLGEGGMGVVYRATDTKLNRDVAIKVLPAAVANDPDRLARFEREARTLAALDHPNIASIYGVEHGALIMQLVEGPTLAERLQSGPLSLEEALPLAHQIADALEAAHDKGIIHRDLKPANIKITAEGNVKLLDFGLAKAIESTPGAGNSNPADSPTLTQHMSAAGVILGTAAYMSPEQARGGAVDRRTDIWAFGVVLYEMLTARRLFEGDTVSDTLAGVLKSDIDLSKLPPATPPWLRRLLVRCLERDRKKRLRDIGDVLWEEPAPIATAVAPSRPNWIFPVLLVAACAVTGLVVWLLQRSSKAPELPLLSFSFPADKLTAVDYLPAAVISPNGKFVACIRDNRLWVHDLEQDQSRLLEGTDNAQGPFWSPDGAFIAFAAGQELRRSPVRGGSAFAVARFDGPYRGGAWSPDGATILIATVPGLFTVPATGGTLRSLNSREAGAPYRPQFIQSSSGESFVLLSVGSRGTQQVVLLNSSTGESRILRDGAYAVFANGYLLFHLSPRDRAVWAQRFSIRSMALEGDAVPLLNNGVHHISVSANGMFAFADSDYLDVRQFVWRDRSGKLLGSILDRVNSLRSLDLSRDGRRIIYDARTDSSYDHWLLDPERNVRTRFTFNARATSGAKWTPSGDEIAYSVATGQATQTQMFVQKADASSGPRPITSNPSMDIPGSWSPDGTILAFTRIAPATGSDLWVVRRKPDGSFEPPTEFLHTRFAEILPEFSPDGRLLAHSSDETGRLEVYVRSFPDGGRKRQISSEGGRYARWRADGKELFYLENDRLMAVPVTDPASPSFGQPVELLRVAPGSAASAGQPYAVTADRKRFIVPELRDADKNRPASIHVVQNWPALLRRATAAPAQEPEP